MQTTLGGGEVVTKLLSLKAHWYLLPGPAPGGAPGSSGLGLGLTQGLTPCPTARTPEVDDEAMEKFAGPGVTARGRADGPGPALGVGELGSPSFPPQASQ